jgi:hypothetical protein
VASIVLAGLTALYVALTFFIVTTSRAQLRAAHAPRLFVRLAEKFNQLAFILTNPSDNPAYDVVGAFIASYEDDAVPLSEIEMTKSVSEQLLKDQARCRTEDGIYGINSWWTYAALPARNAIEYLIPFPAKAFFVEVVLQFRSALGENFMQRFLFGFNDDKREWRLVAVQPDTPHTCKRIPLRQWQGWRARMLPRFLHGPGLGFIRLWNEYSISLATMQAGDDLEWENVGTVTTL